MKKLVLVVMTVLASVAISCDADPSTRASERRAESGTHGHAEGDREDAAATGVSVAPAPRSAATRRIKVIASDKLRFDPSFIEVETGEVVTFVVKNVGKTDHELVLGDTAYQEKHETDMRADDHHMNEVTSGVTVHPGETKLLTWRFNEVGEVLVGCHEPGHYAGGMVGTIQVRSSVAAHFPASDRRFAIALR